MVGCDFETELLKIESDRKKKVNPFDWEAGFPNVFKQGKFDVVIGNPPYIQIQKLSSIYPEQTEYIKNILKQLKNEILIYMLSLLKED